MLPKGVTRVSETVANPFSTHCLELKMEKKTKKSLSILKHFFSERIVRENIYRTCAKSHRGGLLFFSSSASQNKKEFTVPKLLRYEGNVNISVNIPHSNLKNYVGPHVEGNTNTSYFCYYFNCRRLLLTDFFGTIFLLWLHIFTRFSSLSKKKKQFYFTTR